MNIKDMSVMELESMAYKYMINIQALNSSLITIQKEIESRENKPVKEVKNKK